MRRRVPCLCLACLSLLPATATRADIVSVGPFAGSASETWESFANYSDQLVATGSVFLVNGSNPASPTPILGGAATISSPYLAVYEPAVGASFSMGSSGAAEVADGAKAIGNDVDAGTTTLVFAAEVTAFGAWWGALTGPDFPFPNPNSVTVSFFDASDDLLGSDSFDYSRASTRDGVLEWHGWESTGGGIKKVTISGDYVAMDGLQAGGPRSVPALDWTGRVSLALLLAVCAAWRFLPVGRARAAR